MNYIVIIIGVACAFGGIVSCVAGDDSSFGKVYIHSCGHLVK